MPGFDRFIVVLSAQADVLGVGITVIVEPMLVSASTGTSDWIVPGGGALGRSGVESGNAAPLVGGPPGVVLHTTVDALPSGDTGAAVPIVLPARGVGIVPNGADDIIIGFGDVVVASDDVATLRGADWKAVFEFMGNVGRVAAAAEDAGADIEDDATGTVEPGKSVKNDVAGCADMIRYGAVLPAAAGAGVVDAVEGDGIVPVVPPIADIETAGTVGVPGAICPVGVAQVTTVPGVEGSDASGTGASVVSGVPG